MKYTVEVEMTYMQTIEVEAEGKIEAQAIALDKFDILEAYYRRSRAIAYPQGEAA